MVVKQAAVKRVVVVLLFFLIVIYYTFMHERIYNMGPMYVL